MFIIKYKKVFVLISVCLVAVSIALISIFGIPLGIDFKGGAMMQVSYDGTRPEIALVEQLVKESNVGTALIQPAGTNAYTIKTRDLSETERVGLLSSLSVSNSVVVHQDSYTSIGPTVGKDLAHKALLAIILVSLAIIIFIAFAFRGVNKPVSSWKYGLVAIITLIHDIIIPVGVFAVLAKEYGAEVDTLFVVALLTVLGLSISDTIVVFDRVRENLKFKKYSTFSETVGKSIEQAYVRSIATSLTVIMVLVALAIWGPVTTRIFAMMLAAGMFFGTYSSIFLASPLLVYFEKWQTKK
ncbi:MAG: protein translocase subunit SecF [bacterium]